MQAELITASELPVLRMSEWQTLGPAEDGRLADPALRRDDVLLINARRWSPHIEVRPVVGGLTITTTSWVGQVSIGPFVLVIVPKLPKMPLAVLLAYTYGLRDLRRDPSDASLASVRGLQDLLALMFAQEMEVWHRHGPSKRYVGRDELLSSPRGRLLVEEIAKRGGVREPHLPCHAIDRSINWSLNQTLKAGLGFVARLDIEPDLRRRLLRFASAVAVIEDIPLPSEHDIKQARARLTRMTDHWAPALSILALLRAGYGVGTDSLPQHVPQTPGYLFDMNMFFQRLLSRFLRDHAPEFQPVDEAKIRNMFHHETPVRVGHRAPAPRPDLAIRDPDDHLRYLDAKYRDLWTNPMPASWLYQLSVYAMASRPAVSVLLYATTSDEAQDEVIAVSPPVFSSALYARIVVRPVQLLGLAELIGKLNQESGRREARTFARNLLVVASKERRG